MYPDTSLTLTTTPSSMPSPHTDEGTTPPPTLRSQIVSIGPSVIGYIDSDWRCKGVFLSEIALSWHMAYLYNHPSLAEKFCSINHYE